MKNKDIFTDKWHIQGDVLQFGEQTIRIDSIDSFKLTKPIIARLFRIICFFIFAWLCFLLYLDFERFYVSDYPFWESVIKQEILWTAVPLILFIASFFLNHKIVVVANGKKYTKVFLGKKSTLCLGILKREIIKRINNPCHIENKEQNSKSDDTPQLADSEISTREILLDTLKSNLLLFSKFIDADDVTKEDIKNNIDDIIKNDDKLRKALANYVEDNSIPKKELLKFAENAEKIVDKINFHMIMFLILAGLEEQAAEKLKSPDVSASDMQNMLNDVPIENIVLAHTDVLIELHKKFNHNETSARGNTLLIENSYKL